MQKHPAFCFKNISTGTSHLVLTDIKIKSFNYKTFTFIFNSYKFLALNYGYNQGNISLKRVEMLLSTEEIYTFITFILFITCMQCKTFLLGWISRVKIKIRKCHHSNFHQQSWKIKKEINLFLKLNRKDLNFRLH